MPDDPNPGPYRRNAFVEPPVLDEPAPLAPPTRATWSTRKARRLDACVQLAGLPMWVRHWPDDGVDVDARRRPIDVVKVHLRGPITRAQVDRACLDVPRAAPGVHAALSDESIVLTRWSWHDDDLILLAHLLSTWGAALHARFGIVSITVAWWNGGPPSSL